MKGLVVEMLKCWKLLVVSCLCFCPGSVLAIEIRAYDPAKHDRFVNFPGNLADNPTFYLGGEDWSGFGWNVNDTRKHLTLISRKHFVGAAHFRPKVGQQVRFKNQDGIIKNYTISARHSIFNDADPAVPSDLFVGEFTSPIPDGDKVSVVPVYNLPNEDDYVGLDIVASGRNSRAGENTIASVESFGGESGSPIAETLGISFLYSEPGSGDDQCYLIGGDSGGPTAVRTANGFALVGTHSSVLETTGFFETSYTCYDSFLPGYLDRIDAVLEPDGYHVTRFNTTSPDLGMTVAESSDPADSSAGVSYILNITNSVAGEEGHNLRLDLACDAGASFSSATGSGWVVTNGGTSLRAIRGGLDSDSMTTVTVTLNLPDEPSGKVTFSANLSVDGGSSITLTETTEVAQSFESWSAGLVDNGLLQDPDGDGLSNRLEYALGLDGGVAQGEEPLQVVRSGNELDFSFSQRAFGDFHGIEVTLQVSSDLEVWADADMLSAVSVNDGYQGVRTSLSRPLLESEFFRLQVTFREELVF